MSNISGSTKAMAERVQAAADKFIDYATTQAGIDKAAAERVLKAYQKAKIIKLDPVTGSFKVTHGAYLDAENIAHVAKTEAE